MSRLKTITIYVLASITGLSLIYCLMRGLFGIWEDAPKVITPFIISVGGMLAVNAGNWLGIKEVNFTSKELRIAQEYACYFYIVTVLITIAQWGIRWKFKELSQDRGIPEFIPVFAKSSVGLLTGALSIIIRSTKAMIQNILHTLNKTSNL